MKRDTTTKVYPTDADATKKTSYNHTTSGLMLSSKVQAGEEGRKITKKNARDLQMKLLEQQQLSDSRVCRQWFGPRRAGW